ncbi:MAG TPA: hypothetical protein VFV38_14455 [Ktedonobacteraceae bacterium]|nr:hypothetical protein [Ktedonobacteraceae bacterium]
MDVTVSLKIELDASTKLCEMESHIQEAGREAMQEALRQAIRQSEKQQRICPGCGSEQGHGEGTKQRVLLTCFGRVEVALSRVRCEACGQRYRPADRCLEEVKGVNVTPELCRLAALVGCSWPYESAAGVLKPLSGVQICDERVRQLTNEQGSLLAKQQGKEAREVLAEEVNMTHIRGQREQERVSRTEAVPEWLQVGLDGGWIPSREQSGAWRAKSA